MAYLLPQPQLFNQPAVAFNIIVFKVIQEPPAPADHLEEAAPGVVVLLVHLEVLSEVGDSLGEDGYLDFRRSRIAQVGIVLRHDLRLLFFGERHSHSHPVQSPTS